MTENGGEPYGRPDGEPDPWQDDTGSWFRSNRYGTQSQYQQPPGGEYPGDNTVASDPGFPHTGGYPGMSGQRPGMAEPYPSALGDPGAPPPSQAPPSAPGYPPEPPVNPGSPSYPGAPSYPGGPDNTSEPHSPPVSRPYTPPAGAPSNPAGPGERYGPGPGPPPGSQYPGASGGGADPRGAPPGPPPSPSPFPDPGGGFGHAQEPAPWSREGGPAQPGYGPDPQGSPPYSGYPTYPPGAPGSGPTSYQGETTQPGDSSYPPRGPEWHGSGETPPAISDPGWQRGGGPPPAANDPGWQRFNDPGAGGGYAPNPGGGPRDEGSPYADLDGPPSAYREQPSWDSGASEYRVGQLNDPLNDPLDGPRPPSRPAEPAPESGAYDPYGAGRSGAGEPGYGADPTYGAPADRRYTGESPDRYADELSRPRPGDYGSDSPATGAMPGVPAPGGYPQTPPGYGAGAEPGAGQGPPPPGEQGPVSGAPSGSTGGGLGTGSGNTWAFSRDDYTLQDLRNAAMDAVEMQRGAAPDQAPPPPAHDSGSVSGGGPFGDQLPGGTPPTGGFSATGEQPGEGRGGPDDRRPGGPAPPNAADDPLAAIANEQSRAMSAEGGGVDGGSWRNAHGGGPAAPPGEGTQAMPAVSDPLGPDPRGGPDPTPDAGAHGYNPPPPGGYGGPQYTADLGTGGYAGAPAMPADGRGEPGGDAWGGPAPYTGGPGEYGYGAPAAPRYGDRNQEPGYDGHQGYEGDPGHRGYGGYDEFYEQGYRSPAPDYDGYQEYRGYDGRGEYDGPAEFGSYDGYDDHAAERARRGTQRDRIEDDFPDFDGQPLGGATSDPYPGYDNLDDGYWPDTDRGATTTMWFGVAALVPVLGLAGAVAVFIVGPKARQRIRRSEGELEGENLVLTGTILACVGIAITCVVAAWGAMAFVSG